MQHRNPPINEEKLSQLMDGEWYELNPSECVAEICGSEALRSKWARFHLIRDVMKNESVQHDEQMVSRICAAIADEPSYSNITPFSGKSTGDTTHKVALAKADSDESDTVVTRVASSADSLVNKQGAELLEQARRLKHESVVVLPTSQGAVVKHPSMFGTSVAGFALAASVAVVTVVGMNVWQEQTNSADSSVPITTAAAIDGRDAFAQQITGIPLPEVELVANTGSYWVSPETAARVEHDQRLNMLLSHHLEHSPTASQVGLFPYSRLVGYEERSQER